MFLDHAYIVRTRSAYACDGRTYDTYKHINIYQRNSAIELTSVGLAHTRPNDNFDTNYKNSVHLACKHNCNDSTIDHAPISPPSTPEATYSQVSASVIGGSVGGALIVIIILLVLVVFIIAVVVKRKKAAVQSFHTG